MKGKREKKLRGNRAHNYISRSVVGHFTHFFQFIFSIFHATMHYTLSRHTLEREIVTIVHQIEIMVWKISCAFYTFEALELFRRLLFAVCALDIHAEFPRYTWFCFCALIKHKPTRELLGKLTGFHTSTVAEKTKKKKNYIVRGFDHIINFPFSFSYRVTDTLDYRLAYSRIGWSDPCHLSRPQNAVADSRIDI